MKKMFFILVTALVAFSCNKEESVGISERVDRIFIDGKLVKEFRHNQPASNSLVAEIAAEPIPGTLLSKSRNSTGGWNVRCETGGNCCWSCN
jgi:hypothetical protein